jgi:hypothetical protein
VAKTRISSSIKLITFGAFVSGALVACSDDPQPITTFPGQTAGTNSTAGTSSTGGTFGSTAGTGPVGVSGSSFGTAGTPATGGGGAGTAGATTGGTGGAGTAGAGTAGTGVVVPQEPYCKDKPAEALPFNVSAAFYPSAWGPPEEPGLKQIAAPDPMTMGDACGDGRVAGAVGGCIAWRYTPTATPNYAFVAWVKDNMMGFVHPNVCLPADATALTFLARGVKGGEKVVIAGLDANEQEFTLTPKWKRYSIPLTGVTYNSFESGVKSGFSWKIVPVAAPAVQPTVEFFTDDIQVIKGDLPPDPGGEGGAGSGGADGQ